MNRLGRHPYLCLITSGETNPANFEDHKSSILSTVRDAVDDGIDLIQIREKALSGKQLYELANEVVRALKDTSALVLINDRPDVAVASGAHGVHLPEASLPPSVVRRAFGEDLVIGVSTHSIESALNVSTSGADYLFFGPLFETPGKGIPAGLEELEKLCRSVAPFPVLALGGVNEANAGEVFATGAAGLAAIRSMNEKESRRSICKTAQAFKAALR